VPIKTKTEFHPYILIDVYCVISVMRTWRTM